MLLTLNNAFYVQVRNPESSSAAELGTLKGVQLVKCADVSNADFVTAAVDRVIEQTGML